MTDKQFSRYLVHAKGGEIGKRRGWFVAVPRLLNYIPPELVSSWGKAVYRGLCALCSSTGSVRASYVAIAGEAGVSRDTAIREIPKLAEAGLVKIISVVRNHANLYKVIFPSDWPKRIIKAARQALEEIEARKIVAPRGEAAAERDDSAVSAESDEW